MPYYLNIKENNFLTKFRRLLNAKRDRGTDISKAVAGIINSVRKDGDTALLKYTAAYDGFDVIETNIKIDKDIIKKSVDSCSYELIEALKLAKERIVNYHSKQIPDNIDYKDDTGARLGYRWTPIESVGIYVPGGLASYPSSVLMNAIPARVAGVKRIAMVVPTPGGKINPLVLAAAHICDIDEIYPIGGAQAIAALAYGTKSIQSVAKITGPGNAYVAEAKRQVFGKVGIDMIAGPSEILIISDSKSNPSWIAIDLLAQAEHDVSAQSILITDSEEFAAAVSDEIDDQLNILPRADIAKKSWEDFGAIIVVEELNQAISLSNDIAAEHLEIALDYPEDIADKITNAGAIFLGRYTPEAIGDYMAGPNHVLPTSRSARFASGLGVIDFMKRTSIMEFNKESISNIGKNAIAIAKAEGLDAHASSIKVRLSD